MQIISRQFNEIEVIVDNSDIIYLNATKLSKQFKKDLTNWKRSPQTIEYIHSLIKIMNIAEKDLFIIRQGGTPLEQGTWIHISLVDEFLRWLLPTELYVKFKLSGIIDEFQVNNRLSKSIYVVQVSNGTIKIGISSDTKQRFSQIESNCGFDITKQFISEQTEKAYEIEQFLLAYFDDYRINGEWLKNIAFEKVVEKLKSVFAKHHPETIKLSFLEKLK